MSTCFTNSDCDVAEQVLGHVIVILTLNTIYKSVAEWLTSIEPHADQHAAERSMQLKRFFFEAFDCYIALFYLAFVQCDVRRLRVELISIYTIDSVRRIVTESVLPWVLQRSGKNKADPLGEQLLRDDYDSFDGENSQFAFALKRFQLARLLCSKTEWYLCDRLPRDGYRFWLRHALRLCFSAVRPAHDCLHLDRARF